MITYPRDTMIEEVWKIVLGDIVYIPLHHRGMVWAMRDDLDLPVHPFNRPIFRAARFNQVSTGSLQFGGGSTGACASDCGPAGITPEAWRAAWP